MKKFFGVVKDVGPFHFLLQVMFFGRNNITVDLRIWIKVVSKDDFSVFL